MLLALVLATAALADDPAPPSAARRCADAAEGAEIEVCLQLAAEQPEDVDALSAALAAHVDQATGPDRELLTALLLLTSPADGVEGARRLGELGDPRGMPTLEHAVRTREAPVAAASARALAAFPAAIASLSGWVRDDSLSLEVRMAAVESLGGMGRDAAADALLLALRTRGMPGPLRDVLVQTVDAAYPQRRAELSGQVSRDGAAWLAAGTAAGLGYTMGMAGVLGERTSLVPVGAISGLGAGGTLGWVVGRAWPMEAADASFITVTGMTALGAGAMVGAPAEGRVPLWTGLGAGIAGYGLGTALFRAHPGTVSDSLEAGGLSLAAAMALGGMRASLGPTDSRRNAGLRLGGIGALATLAIGHGLTPAVDLSTRDIPLLALGGAAGLTAGWLSSSGEDGLPAAGMGFGLLGAYGLSASGGVSGESVFGATSGAAIFGTLGLGVAMLGTQGEIHDPGKLRTSALVGGLLGVGVGGYVSHATEDVVDKGDVLFTGLVATWTAGQSLGWYEARRSRRAGPRADAAYVLVPSVATGVAGALSPYYDVPISYSLTSVSMGLWGAYLGGTLGEVTGSVDPLTMALVGGNMGVGLGIVSALPPFEAPPLVIGVANAGGVLGASLGAIGTALFTQRRETLLTASLVGAAVGFGTGGVFGASLHHRGSTREVAYLGSLALPGDWMVVPTALTDSERRPVPGARLVVNGW
jgi:hypothetical protein